MKALFPENCRALGFVVLALAVFGPFILFFMGGLVDSNLALVKAIVKVLCIVGALLLFFSMRKGEGKGIEHLRVKALSLGLIFTTLFLILSLIYNVAIGNMGYIDSSSFLIFLILSDICLEYFVIRNNYNQLK